MTDSPCDDLSLIYEWNIADDGLEWFGDIDRMLGFEAGEFPRTIEAWAGRIHPEDQQRLEGAVERHRTHTTPIHEAYRIQHKDGAWLHWMDRGVPVLDDQGRPCKWIGVCTDITESEKDSPGFLGAHFRPSRPENRQSMAPLGAGLHVY